MANTWLGIIPKTIKGVIDLLEVRVTDIENAGSAKAVFLPLTTPITLTKSQNDVVITAANNGTISLPAVVAGDNGIIFKIASHGSSTFTVTIDSTDSYDIDGASTFVLTNETSIEVVYQHSTTSFIVRAA